MSYFLRKIQDLKIITKSPHFSISVFNDSSQDFSIKYIKLTNGRDPAEENLLIELNTGCSAVYTVFKGTFTFTLYNNNQKEEVTLHEKESIHLTSGTRYEVTGDGELQLINTPAYTENTFLHPEK